MAGVDLSQIWAFVEQTSMMLFGFLRHMPVDTLVSPQFYPQMTWQY